MRQLSSNIQTLIANETVQAFYMVLIRHYDDGFIHFNTTSCYCDVTLSNGISYVSDGKLKSADPPQINTNVDREQYKVILSDPAFDEGANVGNGLVGKIMEVRVGFINPATGLPFTNIEDTFVTYKGRVDRTSYLVDTEDGNVDLEIIGVSPLISLDMVKGYYTSRDNVRAQDSTDSSFDSVYEGSGAITVRWGKQ
jgi:hypothetical protein